MPNAADLFNDIDALTALLLTSERRVPGRDDQFAVLANTGAHLFNRVDEFLSWRFAGQLPAS